MTENQSQGQSQDRSLNQSSNPSAKTGQCECGHSRFTISGKPLLRGYCHCDTCRTYNNGADMADVTAFFSRDVKLLDESTVSFKAYQSPPMAKRGKCTQCGKPALERVGMPLLPDVTMVPSANLPPDLVPEPDMHIFYHRRKADAQDNLPKHAGAMRSMGRFMITLLRGMWHARA
jgi:hypothetical protein